MIGEQLDEFLSSVISAGKASISVILVLFYGFIFRKNNMISKTGESEISKLGTGFLLPALLFSEIGPLATAENLKSYWPIIPFSLLFQLVSYFAGVFGKLFGQEQFYVPIFVFNNVTSLPLLLLSALKPTGALDALSEILPHDNLESLVHRARVYILINSLVGNLTRFGFGPYLLRTHDEHVFLHPHQDDPLFVPKPGDEILPTEGRIRLLDEGEQVQENTTNDDEPTEARRVYGAGRINPANWNIKKSKMNSFIIKLKKIINPPLAGGLLAMVFGLIPFTHYQLWNSSGFLSPLANSISNIGALYTALQMFILGSHLYSKRPPANTPKPYLMLFWLFSYRFIIAPLFSIWVIWSVRTRFPSLLLHDPALDYVLMLSNVGPPALTMSAIAAMAGIPEETEGLIAQIITISYIVTPLIALSVTATLEVIKSTSYA